MGLVQNEIEEQIEYIKKIKKINNDKKLNYCILTMGCQLNENDSEKLCGMLENMNYVLVDNFEDADLVIFNTCCVRENAEDKLFGKLGELKNLKMKKDIIIAIGGCMMQEEHITDKVKKSYPFVDIIFGTHTLHRFPENLYNTIINKNKINDVLDIDGKIYEGIPIKRFSNIKASVTIMNGCNNFCSFCIVPYVRGRERSRSPKDILKEIEDLAMEGYKEITLLGQNVNSYKGDGEKGIFKFSELLRKVNEINGIERIKFISPHPKDFKGDVIEAIRDCEKVSKLIHLPLQSGSSSLLKIMNRKYTKEEYINLVEKMREQIPNVTFSTDIIVGFPGESEEDFEDTLDVINKICYEQVYMFIYSRRVGTLADKMENQIDDEIKHKRFDKLKQLVKSQVGENNKKYLNTSQKILVEGISKNNKDMLTGRTDSNKIVVFEGKKECINKMINIQITEDHLWYLKGEV